MIAFIFRHAKVERIFGNINIEIENPQLISFVLKYFVFQK